MPFIVRKDLALETARGSFAAEARSSSGLEFSFIDSGLSRAGSRQARSAPVLPFASLSASFVSAMGAEKVGANQVKEPSTSAVFPEEYCVRGRAPCSTLTGLGVRSKNLVVAKVKVYSIGLYVDHDDVKSVLSKHTSKSAEQIVKDQSVYDEVVKSDNVEKALRLVINYGRLKKAAFVEALDERLAAPLKQAGEEAALEAFRRQFDTVELGKGREFVFSTGKNGTLTTRVDGKEVGSIVSPPLVHALFDIYVGSDPVSAATKQSFGRGLAQILSKQV